MMDDSQVEIFHLQAEICKCLADPKRLMIIHELESGEKSVGELADNTSQHLAILRNAGVIIPRREGSTVFYSLVNPRISDACHLVRSVIADQIHRTQSLAGSF